MKCNADRVGVYVLIGVALCAAAIVTVILLENRMDRQAAVARHVEIKAEIAKVHKELVALNTKLLWWEGNDAGKK